MRTLRYTICSYVPDLHKPEESYDFALVAAVRSKIVLLAVNLSEHGLTAEDPITKAVIEDTPSTVINRLEGICREAGGMSGSEVLRKLAGNNRSSLQYGPVRVTKYVHRFEEQAINIFASRVLKRVALRCKRKKGQGGASAGSPREQSTKQVKFSTKCLSLAGS